MAFCVAGVAQESMFFFEKKNQKTFLRGREPRDRRGPQGVKVFCFFFSKKKCLLALATEA